MTDPTAAAPKKSLFKRPKWAQATSTPPNPTLPLLDENSTDPTEATTVGAAAAATAGAAAAATAAVPSTHQATSIFDRSREFDRIVAEKERRRREKSERRVRREEKEREKEKRRSLEDVHPSGGTVKRRRVEDGEDEEGGSKQTGKEREEKRDVSSPVTSRVEDVASAATVIELLESSDSEDDGGEEAQTNGITRRTSKFTEHLDGVAQAEPPQAPPSDSESDPEIAQLKRNARLKRRLEEASAAAAEKSRLHSVYSNTTSITPTNDTPPPLDPKIQLFITSPIPHSTPLIVTRKLSQRLLEVRDAWCSKQVHVPNFDPAAVFLTFRLRKLYPVTTCRSLGLRVDAQGKIIPDRQRDWIDDDDDDETGPGGEHEGKVHLEAVTADLWARLKQARQSSRTTGSSLHNAATTTDNTTPTDDDDDDNAAAEQQPQQQQQVETVLRITMKAKGFKDVKLKVKPSTSFAKMANAARTRFGEQRPSPGGRIAAETRVVLAFDGEVLEPEGGVVADTEIEDMDGIEVYFK